MKHASLINTFILAATTTLAGCDWMGCDNVYEGEKNISACNARVENGKAEEKAEAAEAYRGYIKERITPEQRAAEAFFAQNLVNFIPAGPQSPGVSDYHINDLGKELQENLSDNNKIQSILTQEHGFPEQNFNASDLSIVFKCHENRPNPIGVYGGERKHDTSSGRSAVSERITQCIVHELI